MIDSHFPFNHQSISILSLTFFLHLIPSFILSHLEDIIQDVPSHFCLSIYFLLYLLLHKEGLILAFLYI